MAGTLVTCVEPWIGCADGSDPVLQGSPDPDISGVLVEFSTSSIRPGMFSGGHKWHSPNQVTTTR
jgi:hypothetical protein